MKVYEEQMNLFQVREKEALAILKIDASTPKDEIQYQLTDRGIYYWQENIEMLTKMKTLKLPEELNEYNKKLIQYCELRIESYRLLSKSVIEESDKYNTDMEKNKKQIDKLLAELQ